MPRTTEERLAVVELEIATIKEDFRESRETMHQMAKSLTDINTTLARGSGAYHAMWVIGNVLGWVVAAAVSVASLVRTH